VRKFVLGLLALLTLTAEGSAYAQAPAPCDAIARPWQNAATTISATTTSDAANPVIEPGQAVMLQLHPDHEVGFVTLPSGQGEESSFAGLATLRITTAGRYLVGVSEPAWIDIADHGLPVATVAFGPGPQCSGIRKGVSFDLPAGMLILELSGNLTDRIGVTLIPTP
jgi:hypothetical protein